MRFMTWKRTILKKIWLFGKAEHLTCFVLSFGNAFDPTAVDLREIRRIVYDERHQNCGEPGQRRQIKGKTGQIEHYHNLKHQRSAAYDPDKGLGEPFERQEFAHRAKGYHEPERYRKY